MARIRSDKPESYQSETLAEISLAAERTFRGMATFADDRGRLADKPAQINGDLWAMRSEREPHAPDDLEAELGEMVKADLVCRYTGCDGKRYIHLVKWDLHQKIDRPSKSRLPRCPHHQADPDYCGRHEGDCPPVKVSQGFGTPSRDSREGSRDLQQTQTGLDADAGTAGSPLQGEPIAAEQRREQPHGQHASEQEERNSSRESRESSMLDLGSRTVDLGSRTVDLGSVPPTAGGRSPRRRLTPAEAAERGKHVGDVVGAYVDGATEAGMKAPPPGLRSRVGKQARELLAEDWDIDFLIDSARRMGASEFNDLGVQVRKDDAAVNGVGVQRGQSGSAADQRRAEVARLREIDRQQREGHPAGTIQGSVIT